MEYAPREAIDWLYDKCSIYHTKPHHTKDRKPPTTTPEVPTFSMVKDYVQETPFQGRMALWKGAAMRVLERLCFSQGFGPVVNERKFDHTKILNTGTILELEALSDYDKIFLTEALTLWLYEYRKNEPNREEFKHALLVEEAHHILSCQRESSEGVETIMETSLRQIREFGEPVIIIDQESTKLANSIKANMYAKITFNLGNGKDALEISNCMGLSREEAEYINLLSTGHAIVSLKGRIYVPLHVVFLKRGRGKEGRKDGDLADLKE